MVALTDSTGTVVDRYSYDAWGKLLSVSEQVPQQLRYAGYWYDNELGWYWLSVRNYDPVLERFLQPDPSQVNGQYNYVYAGDDPLDYTDPSGLDASAGGWTCTRDSCSAEGPTSGGSGTGSSAPSEPALVADPISYFAGLFTDPNEDPSTVLQGWEQYQSTINRDWGSTLPRSTPPPVDLPLSTPSGQNCIQVGLGLDTPHYLDPLLLVELEDTYFANLNVSNVCRNANQQRVQLRNMYYSGDGENRRIDVAASSDPT